MEERVTRQELHCHACDKYVQFDIDLSLDGNHVLECPECGHEHCRVVKNGVITGERWGQRNGPTINVIAVSASMVSTWDCYMSVAATGSDRMFLYDSWVQAAAGSMR